MVFRIHGLMKVQVYNVTSLGKPVWLTDSLSTLPPQLSSDDCVTNHHTAKRTSNQPRETITEILVADIGDTVRTEPYLIVRPPPDPWTRLSYTDALLSYAPLQMI